MFDPLAYDAARTRDRDVAREARRPERRMSEELRHTGRTGRRRRGGSDAA